MNNIFPLLGSKQKGGSAEFCGPCPKCGGDDRFITWPDQGRFWCRVCNWSGDETQFLHDTEGLSYIQACERLGIKPKDKGKEKEIFRSPEPKVERWTPKASALPNDDWTAQANILVDQCAKYISLDKQGMEYALSRGLTNETIKSYKIGWNPDDLCLTREHWGFKPETNPQIRPPKKLFVSKGLVIPTIANGTVVDIKVRRYPWNDSEGMGKYIVVPGSSMPPLRLPGGPCVVVVESELDALLVAQEAKVWASVIALRSASNRPDIETTRLLNNAKIILLATDYDEAGIAAKSWWEQNFTNAFYWPVSVGKDVGDMAAAGISVKEWVRTGIKSFLLQKLTPTSAIFG